MNLYSLKITAGMIFPSEIRTDRQHSESPNQVNAAL